MIQTSKIKIRAERRAGELLKEMQDKGEVDTKGRPEKMLHDETFSDEPQPKHLDEIGVSRIQSHRWKTLADMPEEEFE